MTNQEDPENRRIKNYDVYKSKTWKYTALIKENTMSIKSHTVVVFCQISLLQREQNSCEIGPFCTLEL